MRNLASNDTTWFWHKVLLMNIIESLITYFVKCLLQCDALWGHDVLRDTSGCCCSCIDGHTGVDDGAGRLEDLEVFDAAYAPFEMDHPRDHCRILCQEWSQIGDRWGWLWLGALRELAEFVMGRGKESAQVVWGAGGLQGQADEVVGVLDEALHLVFVCCVWWCCFKAECFVSWVFV